MASGLFLFTARGYSGILSSKYTQGWASICPQSMRRPIHFLVMSIITRQSIFRQYVSQVPFLLFFCRFVCYLPKQSAQDRFYFFMQVADFLYLRLLANCQLLLWSFGTVMTQVRFSFKPTLRLSLTKSSIPFAYSFRSVGNVMLFSWTVVSTTAHCSSSFFRDLSVSQSQDSLSASLQSPLDQCAFSIWSLSWNPMAALS